MKISELIQELSKMKGKYGDLDVYSFAAGSPILADPVLYHSEDDYEVFDKEWDVKNSIIIDS